jgi:glycosyltransferase involved in cell wall biosynthesis
MKISILSPDLSHNCLGRAYLLAKILQRHYQIEIIGPLFDKSIWEPVINDKSITYKFVKLDGKFKSYLDLKNLLGLISGDILYASKPLLASFGIALLRKFRYKKPLILDIDDWQTGFVRDKVTNLSSIGRLKYLINSSLFLYDIASYWNSIIGEQLSNLANEITVSNSFLQQRFGGEIIWHARDTDAFDPRRFNKKLLREKYSVPIQKKIIMFLGTPRPYKGIEDLIAATHLIKDRNVMLALVGIDSDSYCRELVKTGKETLSDRFIGFGLQTFERVPEFLALADVIVIPQRSNLASIGQMPAKVFDAMSMAKPIIATQVSDLPKILESCGWIVKPEDPKELAESIQCILGNYSEAERTGWEARQRCIENYSFNAMEKALLTIFMKYEDRQ